MKNVYLIITIILLLAFLLMPLLAMENKNKTGNTSSGKTVSKVQTSELKDVSEFTVYINSQNTTKKLDRQEYLLGVIAAEISPENNEEAIKAQALAAYTFAYRKKSQNSSSNYDITTDSSLDQGYLTEEERAKKWGEKKDEYEKKILGAIKAVEGKLIVYDNKPILAAYHSVSAGKTETAANVWGTDYPYLQSENSVGDLLAPDYLSEVKLSVDDFKKCCTEKLSCNPAGDPAAFIGKLEKTKAGTVKKISICSKEISGQDVRKAFSLRSAAFTLTYKDNNFIFSVTGYGHGVGMSQFGANYMALQGSSYEEIIKTYYRDVSIVNLK